MKCYRSFAVLACLLVYHPLEMSSSDGSKAGSATVTPGRSISFNLHSLDFLHAPAGASAPGTAPTFHDGMTMMTSETLDEMANTYMDQIDALLKILDASGDHVWEMVQGHLHVDQFHSAALRELRELQGPAPVFTPPVVPTPAVVLDLQPRSRRTCPHCGSHTHKAARCWFLSHPGDAPGSFVLPNMTPERLTHFSDINHPALPQGVVLISGTFNPATNTLLNPVPKAPGSTKSALQASGSAASGPANGRGRGRGRQNKKSAKPVTEASGSATTVPKASPEPVASGIKNGRGRRQNKTPAKSALEASGTVIAVTKASCEPAASGPANGNGRKRHNKTSGKPLTEASGSTTAVPKASCEPAASGPSNGRGCRRPNNKPRA
ncbi:hypothetical protein B0J13DRAFT_612401 [Dactylonectria estremocensis]|uniref:Uncharacterized protein n=1 Tax=Dactylonectria estremocensis TaxID=1079267 RepID=A0A9P9DMW6_9HYPO|nr:hypothetical protein B0J13DRAFT_612401 [Dactylonectria estremocensis]